MPSISAPYPRLGVDPRRNVREAVAGMRGAEIVGRYVAEDEAGKQRRSALLFGHGASLRSERNDRIHAAGSARRRVARGQGGRRQRDRDRCERGWIVRSDTEQEAAHGAA